MDEEKLNLTPDAERELPAASEETDALKEELLSVEKDRVRAHKMSMRASLIVVVAALLVIVLAVSFFGFILPAIRKAQGERTPEKGEKEKTVKVLYDYAEDRVKRVSVQNNVTQDNVVYTPFMNGTKREWNIEGQKYDDVSQYMVSTYMTFSRYMETVYVLPYDESKLDEYGLADPSARVEIEFTDGTSVKLTVGNVFGSDEGAYLLLDGTKEIYVVSVYVYNYFTAPLSSMLSLPKLTRSSLCKTLVLYNGDQDMMELAYIPGPLSGAEAWYMIAPTSCLTDGTVVETLVTELSNLALNSFVAEKAGDDVALYGFDDPAIELQTYDAEGNLLDLFIVGNTVEGSTNERYCVLISDPALKPADARVYTVKESELDLIRLTPVDVANPYMLALNITWLRHGVLHIDGTDYEITVERELRYDDDGNVLLNEDGMEDSIDTYYINGLKLDDKQFRTFYSKILFLSVEGVTKSDTAKGDVVFSYELDVVQPMVDPETEEEFLRDTTYYGKYYRISEAYAVFENADAPTGETPGEADNAVFTVRLRSLESVKESLELLLQGKMPTA